VAPWKSSNKRAALKSCSNDPNAVAQDGYLTYTNVQDCRTACKT
jgi:hypothetical protein